MGIGNWIPHSPLPTPHYPFPIPHSPCPIPHAPFPDYVIGDRNLFPGNCHTIKTRAALLADFLLNCQVV
ncbi:hypothetical protein PI95_028070 [Hassallia byssoidea VB512170]|uniref:Uncharacterized protein n=1 Tax=Hassallia byssoidea VB512170 TaxID=1304833 RepID=A0A846HIN9_9CYAN|nr:hypothetical protein [Hassalia byssoidea]NEU76281.1 hypothetical protein [Hassalia byssoidea VB512170]